MTKPRPLTLADVLETMADAVGDRPALITEDGAWTYAELDVRANRVAHHLRACGVEAGDLVPIHAVNCVEWVDAFLGAFKISAVPININYRYLHDELLHVYRDADARTVVVAPEYAEAVERVYADLGRPVDLLVLGDAWDAAVANRPSSRPEAHRSGDDLYVLYTGGTTGLPKGVMWRQADIIVAALNAMRYGMPIESVEKLGVEAAGNATPMRTATAGPLMHGGSQWILGNCIVGGGTMALYTARSFDAARLLDLAERSQAMSLVALGDAMARPLAEAVLAEPDRWDLSSVVAVSNGAAPLSEAVRVQIREAFPGRFINDSYGSSESGTTATRLDDGTAHAAPRFQAGPDVTVLRPDGSVCEVGEVGMLARSGPIPLGYRNDPEKTAATFKIIDGKRWSVPGDAARLEADGTITVLGRGSVTINTGGEKVHPEEVEGVLLSHPDVADAAVVGTPHPRWGEQVTAVVSLRPGAAPAAEDIRTHCRTRISDFKVPKEVVVVDAVPRTAVAKVDYRRAREVAEQQLGATS